MAVIAIFGPTASGKSAVALELADLVGGEIVSCDAMQLYHGLPILTNQPPPADRERVAHHLVAVWEPSHEGSVAEYADLAHEAIDEILDRGRVPIVCGGSGLYMRSALADMPLPPQAPDGVRDAAERLYDERGPAGAHATLAAVDAPAAAAVHPNDRRRVVRALELAESGHSLTATENSLWSAETRHPTAVAGLTLPPASTAQRIAERTAAMFTAGVAFTQKENLKRVLISLFGATAGQGVVWYTGQFYALFYLQTILKVNARAANYIVAIALVLAMPFFVVFGALSDRIGRKRIMMIGCLLAALSYIPIYHAMQQAAGSNVVTASRLDRATGGTSLVPQSYINGQLVAAKEVLTYTGFGNLVSNSTAWKLIGLVFIQVIFVTMVYGPIAAYLVEAFPAKIRYTSLSLPYHIGNGVFGGLLPVIGLSVVSQTGNIYAGLYYPIIVAGITFIVGSLLLKETRHTLIWDEIK